MAFSPAMLKVRLRKPLERHLRAGHPWVYADALERPRGVESGTVVDVTTREGRFVARGLYDAESPIAVRVATLDAREPVDQQLVRRRIEQALAARRGAFDARETDAFRWLNGEGDFLPGLVADVYRDVAIVRLDGDAVRVWREWAVEALVELGRPLGISYVYERSRGGRGEALHGGVPPVPVEIREHGVRFAVDVVHGQKTGFFLDQRENRFAIRPYAAGVEVANLFGYTGGFSVNAALAGAVRVATIDSAAGAIEAARENFRLNGIDPDAHELACEDAFEWLETARRQGRRFRLVIVDPPSFAPSEKALPKALAAYRDLFALALGVVADGGVLAAASCSSHVALEPFLSALRDAGEKAHRRLRVLETRGQPADHPTTPAFAEGRYLKFVLCRAD